MFKTKKPSVILFCLRFIALVLFSLTVLILLLLSQIILYFSLNLRNKINPWVFQKSAKFCCTLCGYQIRIHGPLPENAGLVVPNHVSYADILVLAALIPSCFVSKIEIKSWPLIGWLARLAGTVFVTRLKERHLLQVNSAIKERLQNGLSVVVFLEGKTSNGNQVLPFCSPLLESVVGESIPIIPVSLKWHSDNPHVNVEEHIAYWRDEHTLIPHMVGHLGHTHKIVDCYFHEAACSSHFTDRKELASAVHASVLEGWQQLHATVANKTKSN